MEGNKWRRKFAPELEEFFVRDLLTRMSLVVEEILEAEGWGGRFQEDGLP